MKKIAALVVVFILLATLLSGCVTMGQDAASTQESGSGSGGAQLGGDAGATCEVGSAQECAVGAIAAEGDENAANTAGTSLQGGDANAGGKSADANAAQPNSREQFFSSPVVQEIVDRIIPSGTPTYGNETISFDNPEESLKFWESVDGYKGKVVSDNLIILEGEDLERYQRVVKNMKCEFCCGPVSIEDCGCNHAAAYRGVAKYLIKYYGSEFSDEELVAEQVRWKSLWFQQATVVKELRLQNKSGELSNDDLNKLLTMVGGC